MRHCFDGVRKQPTISGRFLMPKHNAHFAVLDRKVYAEGTYIFRKGEIGTRAFIIEDGKVEIWNDVDGEHQRLGVVQKGGVFGEMALIDDEPRMASASAMTKTVCIVVPGRMLKDKLKDADPFIVALLRLFVENIRSTASRRRRASDRHANDRE